MNSLSHFNSANQQLLLNSSSTVKVVSYQDIIYIEADDNYSTIYLNDQTRFQLSKTLQSVEKKINDQMFFRCHRSFLINMQFIKEIHKCGEIYILLKNGDKIPFSRRRNGYFKKWISKSKMEAILSLMFIVYDQFCWGDIYFN